MPKRVLGILTLTVRNKLAVAAGLPKEAAEKASALSTEAGIRRKGDPAAFPAAAAASSFTITTTTTAQPGKAATGAEDDAVEASKPAVKAPKIWGQKDGCR